MDIIASNPGTVTRVEIDTAHGQSAILSVGDGTSKLGSFDDGIIVTSIYFGQDANVQFMRTLRDAVYAYAFGDNMGDIQITGVCVARACLGSNMSSNVNGVRNLMNYYSNNRYSALLEPINIVFADETIIGFLVGCKIQTISPDSYMHQFTLLLKALPPKGDLNYPGFSNTSSISDGGNIDWESQQSIVDDGLLLGSEINPNMSFAGPEGNVSSFVGI